MRSDDDLLVKVTGRAGRVTLNRPKALNALTAGMSGQIETALNTWRDDPDVDLVIIDAVGDKAFCAGGDIADLYAQGRSGNVAFGQAFWRQEYRMNLTIAQYPKPVVAFLQGFVMGGGVGVGCHASHRVVAETAQIAMPECGIGLIPDVGGSHILGRAPGATGVYLGLTGARMGPADAIFAGFADCHVPLSEWDDLKKALCETGDTNCIHPQPAPASGDGLDARKAEIDGLFDHGSVADIARVLSETPGDFAAKTLKALRRGAPLAQACALETIRAASTGTLVEALVQEYRYTHRAQDQGDFLEGIRAQIIDRDFAPKWAHASWDIPMEDIAAMLTPLGLEDWTATQDIRQ